jgi:hypothetical protein
LECLPERLLHRARVGVGGAYSEAVLVDVGNRQAHGLWFVRSPYSQRDQVTGRVLAHVSSEHMDRERLEESMRGVEMSRRIVVTSDDDRVAHSGREELSQETEVETSRFVRGLNTVEDVTRDYQHVHLTLPQHSKEPGEERLVLRGARDLSRSESQVPVGGVEDSHGAIVPQNAIFHHAAAIPTPPQNTVVSAAWARPEV